MVFQSHRTPWGYILRTKALWGVMVTHVGSTIAYTLFFVDMPTYLERGLQISLKDVNIHFDFSIAN